MKRLFSALVVCFFLLVFSSVAGAEEGKKNPTASSAPAATFKDPATGMEFVYVKEGDFVMGREEEYAAGPPHEVHVDGFYMGKYEVAQGEWEKVMGNNPSAFKKGVRYPVETVSWDDAQEFIKKLNEMNKGTLHYRLPTEAEWEYAAHGGTKGERYWKEEENPCRYVNLLDQEAKPLKVGADELPCDDGFATTAPVGSFPPNPFGLYDMLGNVSEWCNDWYSDIYYKESPKENPPGPFRSIVTLKMGGATPADNGLVFRGGSWAENLYEVSAITRDYNNSRYRADTLGFRIVLDIQMLLNY